MIKSLLFPVFVFLVVAWVFLSSFRIVGYVGELVFPDLPKIGADEYPDSEYAPMKKLVQEKINSRTEDTFVFSTRDGRKFFILRYLSYPKKVYWQEEGRYPHGIGEVYLSD